MIVKSFHPVVFMEDVNTGKFSAHVHTVDDGLLFVNYFDKPYKDNAQRAIEEAKSKGIKVAKPKEPGNLEKILNWRRVTEKPPIDKGSKHQTVPVIVCSDSNDFFSAHYCYISKAWLRDLEGYEEYQDEEVKCWITLEDLCQTLPNP